MGPKKKLKGCPLFPSGSASPSHRKSKGKKTKEAASIARTIVNCFPSVSASSEPVILSPPREPVRVPRNPLIRSTLRTLPPCTQDIPPKQKRVTFRLPEVSSHKAPTLSRLGLSSSSSTSPSTSAPSLSIDNQVLISSPPLPYGQSLVFSRSRLPDDQSVSNQTAEGSASTESMFWFFMFLQHQL